MAQSHNPAPVGATGVTEDGIPELAEYETGVPAHIVQAGLDVLDDATGGEGIRWGDEDALIVAKIYLAMRRIYGAI